MLLASVALAQQDCNALDRAVFARGLDQVDDAFEAGEPRRAAALLDIVHQRAPCLVEPASAGAMARYAVLRAVAASMEQDQAWMERWVRAALWADPHHSWPEYVGPTHPVRTLEVETASLRVVGPTGVGLAPPEGGAVLLSGVLVERPRVPPEVPVLRQVFDHEVELVEAGWQDGAAFPDTLLREGAPEVPEPEWWAGGTVVRPEPEGPRWSWGSLVVLAGAGSSAQEVDDPGRFLSDGRRAGPLVGAGTSGVIAPRSLGGAWDVKIAPADGWGQLSGHGALAVGLGPLVGLVGGGAITTPVIEGGAPRAVWLPLPHVGVASAIDVGDPWLEVAAGGGWTPAASHLSGRIAVAGGPELSWIAGIEVEWLSTSFVQPDSRREVSVDRVRGGVRIGAAFGR
jgi:hypothetical protein